SAVMSRFRDAASTEISTLSLHDALPISDGLVRWPGGATRRAGGAPLGAGQLVAGGAGPVPGDGVHDPAAREAPLGRPLRTRLSRSEEHTSELQSRENLVCRLLLEKKKHA